MRYVPELDGLRAIAVIAVVLFHADSSGPFSGGFVGVDLFFVLSGFLITSILAGEWRKSGSIDLWAFYRRRFLRLMPPLLLLLAVYLVVSPLLWPRHDYGTEALFVALYLADYSYIFTGLPFHLAHTWSLAVEEHYYLIWPLLLVPLLKAKRPLLWLGAAWVAVTLWRGMHPDLVDHFRFDTRASGLILGGMLYFVPLRGSVLTGLAGLGLFLAVVLAASLKHDLLAIPAAELASVLLIVSCAGLPFLRNPAMVWVGKLSYGIYLWHFTIALVFRDYMPFPAVFILATSIGAAALSYYTIEAWARRFRLEVTDDDNARHVEDAGRGGGIVGAVSSRP